MIPVSRPSISGLEKEFVARALDSSWVGSQGPFLAELEERWSDLCGTAFVVPVNNGTSALHLALLALGVGPGDEVIVPALAYVAAANAVLYVGATPVFVDVDPATWSMDVTTLPVVTTSATRAVIAVHNYGHPVDMAPLVEFTSSHGLSVIEDVAEAPFGACRGQMLGTWGDVATYSFFGNKIVTSGEGGLVTTPHEHLADKIRLLRNQGMDPRKRYYHPEVGYNYRMTNVAAAILCAQLSRLEDLIEKRNAVFAAYDEMLGDVPGIQLQTVAPWATRSPWMYGVVIDGNPRLMFRDSVMERLGDAGIESRPFFHPLHLLPAFQSAPIRVGLPVTEFLGSCGVNLPTFPDLARDEQDHVVASLIDAVAALSRH